MAQTSDLRIQRYGLTECYTPSPPSSALCDIVFVHGLNGDPHDTWTAKNGVFWPKDLLPQFLEEQSCRVLVYGYDADVTTYAEGASKDKIHNHAERLVADLFANRRIRKATERPIVFVAHSLGGLVVKRALIYSNGITGLHTAHLRSIFVSTFGILFMGTPHKGADLAQWGTYLERIAHTIVPKRIFDTNENLIQALKSNSETLETIDRQFMEIIGRFRVYFFHEAKPTDLKGTFKFIVDEASASPVIPDVEKAGIQADHTHMVKFESDTSAGFDLVVESIQRYAEYAPGVVRRRWDNEKRGQTERKVEQTKEMFPDAPERVADELKQPSPQPGSSAQASPGSSQYDLRNSKDLANSTSSRSSPRTNAPSVESSPHLEVRRGSNLARQPEPFLIVPPGFLREAFFVGMDRELGLIDRHLSDKRKREGTSAVLLYGPGGAGKSHLAREYVRQKRFRFTFGIFWVNATTEDEMYRDYGYFWQKVIAKMSPDVVSETCKKDPEKQDCVNSVREWFTTKEEWLIVFDGVNLDRDEEVTRFSRFVPLAKNSSIIFVSRSRRLSTFSEVGSPTAIKVPPLKPEDAKKLLFHELKITQPRETEVKKANELIKSIGGLPLAIEAISRRIAYTRQRLESYNVKTVSEDKRLDEVYGGILNDLRDAGHAEALTLVTIICFFAPRLPVELIHLGIHALQKLDVHVRASEDGGRPDLNITLGQLNAHALIERNETEGDKWSMSSSQNSISDPEPIDMIRMQAVVQKYCCDKLKKDGQLPTNLDRAIELFCASFHNADLKIKQHPDPGRVSDYREYLVHGQCLLKHTYDYESKNQPLARFRNVLNPTLDRIKEEIHLREPSSSQESLNNERVQASIFDRTNSTSASSLSDTSESELDLPAGKKPMPKPLILEGYNEFGFPLDKMSSESPRSAGLPPRDFVRQYTDGDVGTHNVPDGDVLYPIDSTPMIRHHSDTTVKPASSDGGRTETPSTPMRPTADDSDSGWQVVQPYRKPPKPAKSPQPARRAQSQPRWPLQPQTRSELNRQHATADIGYQGPPNRGDSISPWNARDLLTKVRSGSQSPVQAASGSSPSRPSTSTSKTTSDENKRPSWASIVARLRSSSASRSSSQPPSSDGLHQTSAGKPSFAGTSPLRSAVDPQSIPEPFNTQPLHLSSSAPGPDHPQFSYQDQGTISTDVSGRNTAPLPYEPNTTLTRAPASSTAPQSLPLPIGRYDLSQTFPQPTSGGRLPYPAERPPTAPELARSQPISQTQYYPVYPQDPYHLPAGYHSQPLSPYGSYPLRGTGAVTEPPRYPSSQFPPPASQQPASTNSSPLTRVLAAPVPSQPGANPLQPGINYTVPSPSYPPSDFGSTPPGSSHLQDSGFLNGTGSWASHPNTPPLPPTSYPIHFSPGPDNFSPRPPPVAGSAQMARSGSGPGIAIPGGGIAQFGPNGQIVFGDLPPMSLAEARERSRQRNGDGTALGGDPAGGAAGLGISGLNVEGRAANGHVSVPDLSRDTAQSGTDKSGRRGRSSSTPYPVVNLIPTKSNARNLEKQLAEVDRRTSGG